MLDPLKLAEPAEACIGLGRVPGRSLSCWKAETGSGEAGRLRQIGVRGSLGNYRTNLGKHRKHRKQTRKNLGKIGKYRKQKYGQAGARGGGRWASDSEDSGADSDGTEVRKSKHARHLPTEGAADIFFS